MSSSSSIIHHEDKDPSTSGRRNPTSTSSSYWNDNNNVASGIPADDNWNTTPSATAPRTTTTTATATTDSASDRALVNEDQSMATLSTNRTVATPTPPTTMEDGAAKLESSSGRNAHIKSLFQNEDDDDNTDHINPTTDAAIGNDEDEYSMDTISTYPHSIGGTIPGSMAPSYESSTIAGLATVPEDTMTTMPTETVIDRNGINNFQLNNNLQNRFQQQQQQPNYHRPSTIDNQSVSTVSTDPSMIYPGAVRVPGPDAKDHNDDETLIIDSGPAYTGPSTTTAENTIMYYQPYSFERNGTAGGPPTTLQSNDREVMPYSLHHNDATNDRSEFELTNVHHLLKKYRILFIVLVIGLLIVACVGIGIGIDITNRTSSSNDDPMDEDQLQSAVPSASPTAQIICPEYPKSFPIQRLPGQAVAEYEKLLDTDFLSQVLPGLDIGSMEPCSPTQRALVWAANDAVLSGGFSAQRFLLAVIYFALDGNNWTYNYWWLDAQMRPCDPVYAGEDCERLEPYRQELNRENARECLWSHLLCDVNHKVVQFTLTNTKASSSIPSEIGLLTTLTHLDFSVNSITGTVPTDIGRLSKLETLRVDENGLTGSFPFAALYPMHKTLRTLRIGTNHFRGALSTHIGHLKEIEYFDISSGGFGGTIPSEIGSLTKLELLNFQDTLLAGSLPTEIGHLNQLRVISFLSRLGLSGTLRTELGNLKKLGTLPTELGNLKKLESLNLVGAFISGTIPSELGLCTSLAGFAVADTNVTGELPTELGNLSNLQFMQISGCDLRGTLPSEVLVLENLAILNLEDNSLSGSLPNVPLVSLSCLYVAGNSFSGTVPNQYCGGPLMNPNVCQSFITDGCGCCSCKMEIPCNFDDYIAYHEGQQHLFSFD